MRKGAFRNTRRVTAVVAASLVALLVSGTGAGAASTSLNAYEAVGNAAVLDVNLTLPAALNGVAGLPSTIRETISFSRALGQVDPKGITGSGLGQMFDGTLNPVLETVTKALLNKELPKAFASLQSNERKSHQELASINVPQVAPLIHVGVAEVNAETALKSVTSTAKAVVSSSDSKLLGIEVGLGQFAETLKNVLKPVTDLTDNQGGLVDTVNNALNTVEKTVKDTTGLDVSLDLPKIATLLDKPLVKIGLIETASATGFDAVNKGARTASAMSRLADVSLLGGFIKIDSIVMEAKASIDGTRAGANAVTTKATQRIARVQIGTNIIDLQAGALIINNKRIELPTADVLKPLEKLLIDTLGLEISFLSETKPVREPTHALAEARSLVVKLAPKIAGSTLFSLAITGPAARAEVAGTNVLGTSITRHPRTGVATTTYLLAGPALLGLAVLVRRFALTH